MVVPALIIILTIAIWPLINSFWLSLHDVRLNHPAKTKVHTDFGIDLERYINTYPYLVKVLEKEGKKAPSHVNTELDEILHRLDEVAARLDEQEGFSKRFEEVEKLVMAYKPVPDDLKYISIDENVAQELRSVLEETEQTLNRLSPDLQKPKDAIGLTKGLGGSLIEPNFVGFRYYQYFLTDQRLWDSMFNTLFFTVVSVTLELVLGLWIAVLINKQFKGRGLVRSSILIPWAIPTVISALMWKFMYDGQNGIMAFLFEKMGIVDDMGTLLTTKWGAMFSVIVADVWKTTPFMALLIFAGLQTIPDSLYEAADVEGATRWQKFVSITLPMLKPTILVALLFRTLDAFRVFDLIYVLTGGGPANSTETISIYAYKTMFAQLNFGQGSTLSIIVFLCVALISIVYIRLLGTDLLSDSKAK